MKWHDARRSCRNTAWDLARGPLQNDTGPGGGGGTKVGASPRAKLSSTAPTTFEGRLSLLTEPFELSGPAQLRFQSDGPIFVLYLKSADGTVLQNLHIGGGGEDSYRIARAGTYRLQINGSETWRVWVEPEQTQTN
jgi:hypothetical protein